MKLKDIINQRGGVCLTGAGISTESGIPDFRSPTGIWSKYNIEEYAYIDAFYENPKKVWKLLNEIDKQVRNAKPNEAHILLAEMEKKGIISAVITQNIDGLHQKAGSQHVIELHGNANRLICLNCGKTYPNDDKELTIKDNIPYCQCGNILKPDVVFFGEALPIDALQSAQQYIQSATFLLIIGTSLVVAPASFLPNLLPVDKWSIEINLERSALQRQNHIFLQGKASEQMKYLWSLIE